VVLTWHHPLPVLPAAAPLTELFQTTGAGANAALLNTVIIGAVNAASTVVAIVLVDRCGARTWLRGVVSFKD